MIKPAQLTLTKNDGTTRNIIIEPILVEHNKALRDTRTYKIFKDAFGEESALFTEPLEIDEQNDDLANSINPDFLGKIIVKDISDWNYEGDLLSAAEQKQAAKYILTYKDL
jgi:hypothetical protein